MKKNVKKILIGLSIMTIGIVIVMILFYQSHIRVVSSSTYNQYLEFVTFKDGKVALRSLKSGKIVSPKVDEILGGTGDFFMSDADTSSIYINNNKYGYLNNRRGDVLIKAEKFDHAWNFDAESGLAAVVENGKLGFINRQGDYVIKPQYTYRNAYYPAQEFGFKDGFSLIPDTSTRKLGLIDIHNKMVLKPIYDEISRIENGYTEISCEGKYGLADSTFRIVIKPEFDFISLNDQGIVLSDNKHNRQFMLAYDYKTIITAYVFDGVEKISIEEEYYDEGEETSVYSSEESGYSRFYINDKVGAIDDKTGRIIIPAKWDEIEYHSQGIFLVGLDDNQFLINTSGKIIN